MIIDGSIPVLATVFIIVLFITLGGGLLTALVHLSHVAGTTWRADIAPFAEKTIKLYPLTYFLLAILLAMPESTFPYYRAELAQEFHINAWHNYSFLVAREIGLLMLMAVVHFAFVRASARDRSEATTASRSRLTQYAALFLVVFTGYGTIVAWDFEMTLTPGWHSPIYAPYFLVSNFHMFLGFFVVWLFVLSKSRHVELGVADQSFNYLAQMMLGFTLLWIYTFFAQFITIWYGNIPEETARLYPMLFEDGDIRKGPSEMAPIFWTFIVLKSFLPFVLLVFAVFRHNAILTAFVGGLIFIGTCLERYTWVATPYEREQSLLSSILSMVIILVALIAVFWLLKRAVLSGESKPAETAGTSLQSSGSIK